MFWRSDVRLGNFPGFSKGREDAGEMTGFRPRTGVFLHLNLNTNMILCRSEGKKKESAKPPRKTSPL